MPDASPLLFHVIYTPGTVRALLPFVGTLLRWSECAFCLVSNGCHDEEMSLLRARCAGESQLTWRTLPFARKVEHGQALNFLFAAAEQPYFCFMDSDILATGDFMAELRPSLPRAAALFSAWPVTIKPGERILPDECRFIGGRHSETATGLCLGGSYFAIYERTALYRAFVQAPDGFNRGYWAQLPRRTRRFLRGIGQERLFYDTGRVLNFYIQSRGGELRVRDCASLLHLGSYSIYAGGGVTQRMMPPWLKMGRSVGRWVRNHLDGQAYRTAVLRRVAQDPIQRVVDQRRAQLSRYFATLVASLAAGGKPPVLPEALDGEIAVDAEKLVDALETLHGMRRSGESRARTGSEG